MSGTIVPQLVVALACVLVAKGHRVARQPPGAAALLDESSSASAAAAASGGRFSPTRALIPPLGLAARRGTDVSSQGAALPVASAGPQRPASWLGAAGAFSSEPPPGAEGTVEEKKGGEGDVETDGAGDDWVSRAFEDVEVDHAAGSDLKTEKKERKFDYMDDFYKRFYQGGHDEDVKADSDTKKSAREKRYSEIDSFYSDFYGGDQRDIGVQRRPPGTASLLDASSSASAAAGGRFSPARALIPPLGLFARRGADAPVPGAAPPVVSAGPKRPASSLGAGSFSSEPLPRADSTGEEKEIEGSRQAEGQRDDWVSRAFNDVDVDNSAGSDTENDNRIRLMHIQQSNMPAMERLTAKGMWNGEPGSYEINLPRSWVRRFAPGSIRINGRQKTPSVLAAGTARLAADPSRVVHFTSLRRDGHEEHRELIKWGKIHSMDGIVPVLIDTVESPAATFILHEHATRSLASVIESQSPPDGLERVSTLMPLTAALPLMIDMLRALVVLKKEDSAVEEDLTEHNIFVRDGGKSIMMVLNHFGSSAWRQPPELLPALHRWEGNVFQLGLVFAKMLVGGDLWTKRAVHEKFPGKDLDDATMLGRHAIHAAIHRVDILPKDDERYRKIAIKYQPVMAVIEGMLLKDPSKRLTAEEALELLVKVADEHWRGVAKPEFPTPGAEVKEWKRVWGESAAH